MPLPCRFNYFFRVAVLRLPSQHFFTLGAGGDQHRRISRPPGFFLYFKINARNRFGRLNNFPYTETGLAAQVEHIAGAAISQVLHRQHMGIRQVQYVADNLCRKWKYGRARPVPPLKSKESDGIPDYGLPRWIRPMQRRPR